MIRAVIIFGLLSTFASCSSQKQIKSYTKNELVRVIIHDFNKPLPFCGFINTKSIYRAEIKDYNRKRYGNEILLYAICKADNFKKNIDDKEEVYIEIYPNTSDDKNVTVFNFSGYSKEELKNKKEYQIISINNNK